MRPLGIFLNFLFYFNFLVSKTQFKISTEKNYCLGLGVLLMSGGRWFVQQNCAVFSLHSLG